MNIERNNVFEVTSVEQKERKFSLTLDDKVNWILDINKHALLIISIIIAIFIAGYGFMINTCFSNLNSRIDTMYKGLYSLVYTNNKEFELKLKEYSLEIDKRFNEINKTKQK